MDNALRVSQKIWEKEVSEVGKIEASIRYKQREIEFYCELGIMRDGEIYEWKPGHFEDSRVGALPTMWKRLVMDQTN